MRTPICERLDIEFPIFAFSHCRDVVAAVSKAGGYGVLGALAFSPEQLEIELNWIDEHIDGKPYGVDIVMPAKYVGKGGGAEASVQSLDALIPDEHRRVRRRAARRVRHPAAPRGAERWGGEGGRAQRRRRGPGPGRGVAAASRCRCSSTRSGRCRPTWRQQAHDHGILVGALVGAARARRAPGRCRASTCSSRRAPRPAVTAARSRRWCSCPRWSTRSAPTCPCSRRAASAAVARWPPRSRSARRACGPGRSGSPSPRADTGAAALDNLLAATSRDTVRSRAMTGKPARQLRTGWTDAWERPTRPIRCRCRCRASSTRAPRAGSAACRRPELSGSPVGQIVGRMNEVRPTRDVDLRHGRGVDRDDRAPQADRRRRLTRHTNWRQQSARQVATAASWVSPVRSERDGTGQLRRRRVPCPSRRRALRPGRARAGRTGRRDGRPALRGRRRRRGRHRARRCCRT